MPAPADRPYVFHAFEVSYFSAKVRPALRYKRLWYDEVHADSGLIRERTGLTFIPMLLTPEDEAWQDSTDIYDRLEARHHVAKRSSPRNQAGARSRARVVAQAPAHPTPERALNRSRRTPVRTGAWRTSRRRSIGAEETASRIKAEAGLPVS